MNSSYHTPVMYTQVLSGLSITPSHWYIDGTIGGGGYGTGILGHGGKILGIDTDQEALLFTRKRFLQEHPEKQEGIDWILVHGNFRHLNNIWPKQGIKSALLGGIVLDLGVSSHQLDSQARGFSFRHPAALLDLRLDQSQGEDASSVVNTRSREELYDIFAYYGEETHSQIIADALVKFRQGKRIETVGDFIEGIQKKTGKTIDERTLARVFQALRIYVNDELGALKDGLAGAEEILPLGSKLCVISFHSLEDRIVKQRFRNGRWKLKGVVTQAQEEEMRENRRSRSAKLRIGEKI